jgi:hypothetical protein
MDNLKCVQLLCKADASGVPVLLRMTGEGVHNSAAACGEAAGRASVPGRPRHQGLFTPFVPTTATFSTNPRDDHASQCRQDRELV